MRLEHYPVDKLKKEVLVIIGKHLDLKEYKVFFFGSRVLGKGDDRSDIDIGIEGKGLVPAKAMRAIQEALFNEIKTLYKIDFVDFTDTNEKFKQVAKEKIEYLN
ncbi:MAG: nucleotidyltransferase domain-containing protein [bacterium]|nr:nucleotidyltransferase domain-containing protein [bacterium]